MINFENIKNLPKFCGTYATIIVNYLDFRFATQFILLHCTQEYKMSKLRKFQVKPIKTSNFINARATRATKPVARAFL